MGRLERSPTVPQAVIEAAAINISVSFEILFIFILLLAQKRLYSLSAQAIAVKNHFRTEKSECCISANSFLI